MNITESTTYDVIVISAGYKGLTCATYLARSGLKVNVVERCGTVSGAAVTEEFYPGFRNSVCSYAVGLLNPKVVEDLGLYGHGLKIIERPLALFVPLENGDYIKQCADPQRMQAEVARHSEKDAANLEGFSPISNA